MNIEVGVALDALSIVYMVILSFNQRARARRELLTRQYRRIVLVICVFLALDIAYLLLYGGTDVRSLALLKLSKSLYFVANSAIVWLWTRYTDCILFGDRYRSHRHRLFYAAVFSVNCAIVVGNLFTGVLFRISPQGTFVVGAAAMWLFTALNYLSILFAMAVLINNRKNVKQGSLLPLLLFPLPPLLAELVQIFLRPFSLICTYAVSALIVYQVSQNSTIYTDELTGLGNRRLLDESLHRWLSAPRGAMVCGVRADLDGLKQINDTYGHLSGDNALLTLAGILKEVRRRELVSARYGGDEFVLVWLSEDGRDLPAVERALTASKERVNGTRPPHERIEFSVGTFCCRDRDALTPQDFLKKIDEQMYRSKNRKKQGRSGPSVR